MAGEEMNGLPNVKLGSEVRGERDRDVATGGPVIVSIEGATLDLVDGFGSEIMTFVPSEEPLD